MTDQAPHPGPVDLQAAPLGRAPNSMSCQSDVGNAGLGRHELRKGEEERRPGFRERIEARATLRRTYRVGVAVLGGLVLLAGMFMIPYPGPGWAVVFIGLAILATEFIWARRVLQFARSKYDAWTDWLGRQSLLVRLTVLAGTGLVVVATLYLLNVFYLVAGWLRLAEWTWLQSPFFR
jgi:uncharacterized protein (TIGR02611 family)